MYAHPTSCYPGIYSVMDNAATATLLDMTRTWVHPSPDSILLLRLGEESAEQWGTVT